MLRVQGRPRWTLPAGRRSEAEEEEEEDEERGSAGYVRWDQAARSTRVKVRARASHSSLSTFRGRATDWLDQIARTNLRVWGRETLNARGLVCQVPILVPLLYL